MRARGWCGVFGEAGGAGGGGCQWQRKFLLQCHCHGHCCAEATGPRRGVLLCQGGLHYPLHPSHPTRCLQGYRRVGFHSPTHPHSLPSTTSTTTIRSPHLIPPLSSPFSNPRSASRTCREPRARGLEVWRVEGCEGVKAEATGVGAQGGRGGRGRRWCSGILAQCGSSKPRTELLVAAGEDVWLRRLPPGCARRNYLFPATSDRYSAALCVQETTMGSLCAQHNAQ